MSTAAQVGEALTSGARRAAGRATEALRALRIEESYWCGRLTAGTTLEPDFVLLQLWLYPPAGRDWNPPARPVLEKAVRSILARQLGDGGFPLYPGGPAEISATVKAYCALKLAGQGPDDPRMLRARACVLDRGGIQAASSYVKIHLSLFGLYPGEYCPSVPIELMLAGNLIYEMSSWARATVIPLAIVQALDPGRRAPEGFTLEELILPGRSFAPPAEEGPVSWGGFFRVLDRGLKLWERHGLRSVRQMAVDRGRDWLLERIRRPEGLPAVHPPVMYAIMALDALGFGPEHPERAEAERQFQKLALEEEGRLHIQPSFLPVRDTSLAAHAIGEAEAAPTDDLRKTGDWLLGREVRGRGDWIVKRPGVEPGGWALASSNERCPDIDGTAMALLALRHTRPSDPTAREAAVRRATRWLRALQSRDGGWAAFDAGNGWKPLSRVPFADRGAMLDPTCPDITGRVLDALCQHGRSGPDRVIENGIRYLTRTQRPDGSWPGRWGVNHVYGTFLALRGLRAAGESDREAHVLRAGEWLRSIQNADGGWGESCASYDAGEFVPAPSTAPQTAWAVLGLLAAGDASSEAVNCGVRFLLERQREDGGWEEEQATATGFPGCLYVTHSLYSLCYPLLALGTYRRTHAPAAGADSP